MLVRLACSLQTVRLRFLLHWPDRTYGCYNEREQRGPRHRRRAGYEEGVTVAKKTPGATRARLGMRPKDLLTVSNLTKLPSNLATVRRFINAVNFKAAQEDVEGELKHKV